MKIIRNDAVAKFILDGVFDDPICAPFAGFVIVEKGFPVGAYILNGYTGSNVELTGALRCAVSIGAARQFARDCFEGLGVSRITAHTRISNEPARKSLEQLGFRLESLAKDHFGNEDAAVYALLKREQKLVRL